MQFCKIFLLFTVLFQFMSCAKTEDEEVRSAINEANYHLNSMSCSDAQDVLDDVDFQDDNADYLSVYAASLACYAGYKELDILFGGNLDDINSTSLIASLAGFSSSNETEADSSDFTYLLQAIKTLIENDGGDQPSTVTRNSKFGIKESGDLSLQALYLIFVSMGKFYAYYGNADNTGTKGGGTQSNSCLFSYTTQDAVDWIGDTNPGSCIAATGSEGSDDLELPVTAAVIKRRMCEGIYLYQNMMNILSNITLPGSSELGDVGNVQTTLATLYTAGITAETTAGGGIYNNGAAAGQNAMTTFQDITGVDECEAEAIEKIEKFYAIFLETIF